MGVFAKGHRKVEGRKQGTPNRQTADVRAAILDAYEALGGVKGLTRWAKANPTAFYTKLWVKLLMAELKAEERAGAADRRVVLVTEIVTERAEARGMLGQDRDGVMADRRSVAVS